MSGATFGVRLKSLLMHTGMTATELADRLGVSRQSVSFWTTDRNQPSAEKTQKIADMFGVPVMWLRTGIDDINMESVTLAENVKGNDDYVFIPEYKLSFGCSSGGVDAPPEWEVVPAGAAVYRKIFFQQRYVDPAKCKRVCAEGDSMEPLICDGDRVLFEELPEGTPIRDGAIYVLSTGGSLKIKRLYRKINGDLIIRSENPKYADEIVPNTEIDSLIRIYGRALERSGAL